MLSLGRMRPMRSGLRAGGRARGRGWRAIGFANPAKAATSLRVDKEMLSGPEQGCEYLVETIQVICHAKSQR